MKTRHLLTFLILFSTIYLGAAETKVFSLAEAKGFALEHNRNMKAAGLAITKSEMMLREAIANGLPQIAANADYSNALGAKIVIRFNENMPASEIDIKPTSNLFFNVNQLIFSGSYIVGIQLARLSKELSELSRERTELEVLASVTEAYYMAQITAESRLILEQNVKNLEALYEKTAAMARVGMIESVNAEQLEVQLSNIRSSLASLERQHTMALNLLRLQLGLDPETPLQLTDNIGTLLAGQDPVIPEVKLNLNTQIDFRMILQQEKLMHKRIDLQRAAALPTVAGFYRYTYKVLKPDFDMTPKNIIGLQLQIPIFSSGLRHYRTQQAKIDLLTVENSKMLLTDQLKIQEKQLTFNLNNALEQYDNQRRSIEVSRRVYQSLRDKFENGLISGLDLITADNNYLRAESDYLNAMMQVLNAKLQLDKLYGKL
ncbi:MAG TPA: TolC family protein [Bacteroidales bacterium]|nr:TolC family protein [Bacteroidales bacterium]